MSGNWSYDWPNRRLRIDRMKMGVYDQLCHGAKLAGDANDSCVNLVSSGVRYLYTTAPEATGNSRCCECCTAAQGCGMVSPAWVSSASYDGQEPAGLNAEMCDKWFVQGEGKNYIWFSAVPGARQGALVALQQFDPRDPGAIDTDNFDPASWRNGTGAVDPSVFVVPTACTNASLCPGFCEVLRKRE